MLQVVAMSLLVLALGAAFLLAGYRLFYILLPIWSFVVGFWLGAQASALLLGQDFLSTTTGWIVGLALGMILAALSYLSLAVGVVLLGASFGAWFGASMMLVLGFDAGFLLNAATVFTAIIFAALTVILDVKKHLIIGITALVGASAIITAYSLFTGTLTMDRFQLGGNVLGPVLDTSAFWLIGWLLLSLAGIAIQERTTRGFYLEVDQQLNDES